MMIFCEHPGEGGEHQHAEQDRGKGAVSSGCGKLILCAVGDGVSKVIEVVGVVKVDVTGLVGLLTGLHQRESDLHGLCQQGLTRYRFRLGKHIMSFLELSQFQVAVCIGDKINGRRLAALSGGHPIAVVRFDRCGIFAAVQQNE